MHILIHLFPPLERNHCNWNHAVIHGVLGLNFVVAVGNSSCSLFSALGETSAALKHNAEYMCLFFPLPVLIKGNSALEIFMPM